MTNVTFRGLVKRDEDLVGVEEEEQVGLGWGAWGLCYSSQELVLEVGGAVLDSTPFWILNMFACHLYSALVRKAERKGKLESDNLAAPLRDCHLLF